MAYPVATYPKYGAAGKFPKATRVQPTTDSGWKTFEAGKGRLFLPAGINYIPNPRPVGYGAVALGQQATSWTSLADKLVGSVSEGVMADGTPGMRMDVTSVTDSAASICTLAQTTGTSNIAGGEYWTLSFDAEWSLTGTGNVSAYTVPNSQWYRSSAIADVAGSGRAHYSGTSLVAAGGSAADTIAAFYMHLLEPGASGYLIVANVQLEKSSILTPYFDGSTAGCSWSGTANASTSVRAQSNLAYPVAVAGMTSRTNAGSVTPLFSDVSLGGGLSRLVDLLGGASNSTSLWNQRLSGHPGTYTSATTWAAEERMSFIDRAQESGTSNRLLKAASASIAITTISSPTSIRVAESDQPISQQYLKNLAICPARITDAETAYLSSMLASCSGAELYKKLYDWGYYGSMVIPLESDSMSYIVGGGSTPRDNYGYSSVAATTDTGYEVYDG